MKSIFAAAAILLFPACVIADGGHPPVASYDECVKAGFPVMRSMPPRCVVPGGQVFTQPAEILPAPAAEPAAPIGAAPAVPPVRIDAPAAEAPAAGGGFCKNLCGDGICQEIVCMAEGCPCSESKGTCPTDCQ